MSSFQLTGRALALHRKRKAKVSQPWPLRLPSCKPSADQPLRDQLLCWMRAVRLTRTGKPNWLRYTEGVTPFQRLKA